MDHHVSNQLSGINPALPALPEFLRATSAITAARFHPYTRQVEAQETNYDKMVGGGAEEQFMTRDALAARDKKKKKPIGSLINEDFTDNHITWNNDDFGHARARRGRGDVDGRKRVSDGERRIATDEDGKRVIVDEDGRIATDADGKRITLDAESGYRIADAGDGSRVIVDSQNRVLNDETGKPIRVNADSELIITTESDGSRVAVTADGAERLTMRDRVAPATDPLAESRPAIPGPDLEVVRSPVPVIAGTPEAETLARDFARVEELPSTSRFDSFLTQQGVTLDEFQQSVTAASAEGGNVPRGADVSIPHQRLDVGHVRGARFLRMLTPNGFDVAIPVLIGAGVGGVAGAAAGTMDGVSVGANGVEQNFNWSSFGETALQTGGYTALDVGMFTGTGVAIYEGRNSEATVRAIEDGIELASPFVMAGAGAAIGATGGGIGAIPGAIIGFLAGSVVTIFASDITRSIARGLGYEDVDRGMIGSFIAPSYMEEMESWVAQFSKDGEGWREGESVAAVLERIEAGADTPLERAQNFRAFMGQIVEGIDGTQRSELEPFAARIEADTGIEGVENIINALRIPGARNQMLAFYREELANDPQDAELGDIVSMIETFEAAETERVNAIAAVAGGETMIAREANTELAELMQDTGSLDLYLAPNRRTRDQGLRTVREELEAMGYGDRVSAILERLEISEDTKVSEVVARNLAGGTDAYAELGTRQGLFEAYALMVDVEDQLALRQNAFVTVNWDQIGQMMMLSNDIDRPWYSFSGDTTLGAAIQDALSDAGPNDPVAAELRTLLAQTDNLENMSPEMAAKLLDNRIFREAFLEAIENDDPELRAAFRTSGFERRADAIDDARKTMRRLQAAGQKYGFTMEMVPAEEIEAEPVVAPTVNPAFAIPRAPAPAPRPY